MFPRKMRLRVQDSLKRKPLWVVASDSLSIKVFSGTGQENRFGVFLGRRLGARAVDRNHLKRKVFEALQPLAHQAPPHDFLVIPHLRAATMTKKEIKQTLFSLLSRLPQYKKT